MNQEEIIHGLLLCTIIYIIISIFVYIKIHFKLHKLIKQNPMANFNDLQNSINTLTEAATKLQSDVTAYVETHSSDITSAQGDTLATSINAISATINQISSTLNPA